MGKKEVAKKKNNRRSRKKFSLLYIQRVAQFSKRT